MPRVPYVISFEKSLLTRTSINLLLMYILFLTPQIGGRMSVSKEIEKRIEAAEPDTTFVPSDFHDIASVDNANATLSRMAKKGRTRARRARRVR